MKIAYIVSEYPMITHTFIRREILGVEKRGVQVTRISIRKPPKSELTNLIDKEEYDITQFILNRKAILLYDLFVSFIRNPIKFTCTLFKAIFWTSGMTGLFFATLPPLSFVSGSLSKF